MTGDRFTSYVIRHFSPDLAPFAGTFFARPANGNAIDPVKVEARKAELAARQTLIAESGIAPGVVVVFTGKTRRYAVTGIDVNGALVLRALSGSVAGSGPSGVLPEDITVIPGAPVAFEGRMAAKLRGAYGLSLISHGNHGLLR